MSEPEARPRRRIGSHVAVSLVSLLLGAGIGGAAAEPSQPAVTGSRQTTDAPRVTVTVTETARAPRPVTVTETEPAPPPVTVTVTETAPAPPPVTVTEVAQAPPPAVTAPAAEPEPAGDCNPAYSGACVPTGVRDVDCTELSARDFASVGSDPYGLDGDDDGVACES